MTRRFSRHHCRLRWVLDAIQELKRTTTLLREDSKGLVAELVVVQPACPALTCYVCPWD